MQQNLPKTIIRFLLAGLFVFSTSTTNAQKYKKMLNDNTVNVYDVVKEAENYFNQMSKKDKDAKGSGWKGYQRWLFENEAKFYPSGDRSNVDPYFVSNSYSNFKKNNPKSTENKLFNTGWEDLGPYTIEQVTGHYAVGLGRVESFYVNPNNSDHIYLGSRSGGFWKTLNGGQSWSGGSTDFLDASGVNTIAVSPSNPNETLINVRNAKNGTTHGIYRSTDGGDNWTITNFNPSNLGWGGLGSNRQVYTIAYHPTIANLVFVGTNNGLFRSTDNLTTWIPLLGSYDITQIEFHPTNANKMYVNTNNDKTIILVSSDGGLNFTTTSIVGNTSSIHLDTSLDCPNCVYIGTGDGIWKSVDEGASFTFIGNHGLGNYGGFAVSDVDENIVLNGNIDVHMSSDGGLSFNKTTFWSQGNSNYASNTAYVHADIRGAHFQDGVFWINTDGFLCKSSDNGVTWQLFEGQGIRENYNLGLSQSNHNRTISGSQDNGTSIKSDNNWIEFYGADGMEGIIHPLNDDWMIGSLQNGGRRRTKDGGLTQDGVTPSGQVGYWIAPLVYDPNNLSTVYHFGENVFKSEDFGSTWANIGAPTFTGVIKYATIAENNSNVMVVASNQYIEKTIDGGVTFTSIKGNLPNYSITDVAFDPNDDSVIVVTYGRYQNDNSKVFISTDQGATWQNITYNLNNMPVRSVVIDHTDASTIYLGTEIGVYKKAMADNSWSLYNQDLPNVAILELEVMYGSNTLRAATWGRGLWEYSLDGRSDFPAILKTEITQQPTEELPSFGVDQFVTSTISYDNAISNAYVKWSANSTNFDNTIAMTNTSGDTWVSNTAIPNFPEGTMMYFKVFAEGANSDISETYKFSYEVQAGAPEFLVDYGSSWSYYDNQNEPSVQGSYDWNDVAFDDSSWAIGNAQLGYGDGDETTIINSATETAYFRKTFNVTDPSIYSSLKVDLTYDDGAVVYLNGEEVWRVNMPTGAVNYNTVTPAQSSDNALANTTIANTLIAGENEIAVEVHQRSTSSSDISFDLQLSTIPVSTSESIIAADEEWKYLDNGSDQGTAWTTIGFDDSLWASGNAELGYGDTQTTLLGYGPDSANKYPTTYFRKTFNITDPSAFDFLEMEIVRDDGMAVYLNGNLVWDDNMPTSWDYLTYASGTVSGAGETTWLSQVIASSLVSGQNVIAVEMHQVNASSSDISFNFRMSGSTEQAANIVRGPYLQKGSSNSMVVKWRTLLPTESIVNYGSALGNLNQSVEDLTLKTEHEIEITGLNSDTKYYYEIANSAGVILVEDNSQYFNTHPDIGTSEPFTFWILGDPGTANSNQRAVRDAYYNYIGSNHTDGILFLGDNAYNSGTDSEYQYAMFENMYEDKLKNTIAWSTLGNHDGYTADSATQTGPYYDIFTFPTAGESGGMASGTEAYYSFDYGNIHFIVLDSYETDRSVGGAMYNWAQGDIQNTTQEWIVALWHHPPYTKGSHDSDTEGNLIDMRQNFLPMLEGNGVDLVLAGHSHSYERSYFLNDHYGDSNTFNSLSHTVGVNGDGDGKSDGTGAYSKSPSTTEGAVYITTGSAGKTSGGTLDHEAMFYSVSQLGSCVLEVEGSSLNVKFIRETGAIEDYFTIEKSNCDVGTSCDDGDSCTENDVYDADCNCSGTPVTDSDGDGICDTEDICPGFDDTVDTDGDSLPDGCDTCPNDANNDADGDGVCGDLDICPGGDDSIDTDGDGTPDFCDSCNDLVDTDSDGINDCNDQEINSLCPNSVDANGVSIDSDGDGVCDDLDICPGGDDTIDTDGDGTPDFCDSCNDLVDTDSDGISDCDDLEINSPCPNNVDENGVSLDSDGDGVCDDNDICAGGDDAIDTDGDGTPDFCDTCNDIVDTDSDGINDCNDQEINSPCPNNVDANGVSLDSDGDGICDDLDMCPGGDDTTDTDGDGIPDDCDNSCVPNSTTFSPSTLTHSGSGSTNTSASIPVDGQDISFMVSGLNQKIDGKKSNRFIEEVTISYINEQGISQSYGVFTANNGSTINISIPEIVQSITVNLTDGYDGNSSVNMSVTLSQVDFCAKIVQCPDSDGDGVCDVNDVCAGFDDNIDLDGDGIPDGCDTCNDLIDSDGDDVSDCIDQEDNSPCPNNVDAYGVSLDSDSDGVCDDLDICTDGDDALDSDSDGTPDFCDVCPGFDDTLLGTACDDGDSCTINDVYVDCDTCQGTFTDSDGDGVCVGDDPDDNDGCVPDANSGACNQCIANTSQFPNNPFSHSGTGSSVTEIIYPFNQTEINFTISNLDQRTGGKPTNRYIDVVDVNYLDSSGTTKFYGTFSGASISSVNIVIMEEVQSISVTLREGYDGDSNTTLSVNFSDVTSCQKSAAKTTFIDTDHIANRATVKIYPNPVSDRLNIEIENYNYYKASATLYNVIGQVINQVSIDKSKFSLDINNYKEGLYLLIVKDSNGKMLKSERIIIKK